ncbi:hypothetical protein C2S52_008198 [Perilla frutescens var. hirtella]|nr:hypothetical protein C2S52_008198 [Perilla frutescens var. hirtella]
MSRFICILIAVLCVLVPTKLVSVVAQNICPLSSVTVDQIPTGRSVASKPEWKVNITSECFCTVLDLTLLCPKFTSGIEVNPPVISVDKDGHCVVKTLNPIHSGDSVVFTYAADRIQFQPLSFNEACS